MVEGGVLTAGRVIEQLLDRDEKITLRAFEAHHVFYHMKEQLQYTFLHLFRGVTLFKRLPQLFHGS